MMTTDAYNILHISPTTDKRAIKKAYAKQCAIYHPEEYPEEFKKIQEAYQQALVYANSNQKYNEDDMAFHNDIHRSLHKLKSKEIIMDVEFSNFNKRMDNISELEINLEPIKEDNNNHNLSLDVNLESINEESDEKDNSKKYSSHINLESIYEEWKKHSGKYNKLDINRHELNKNQYLYEKECINYILNKIDDQLKSNPSAEILKDIFYHKMVITYLDINEFKDIFQNILLKYEPLYSDAALEYIQVEAKNYKLTKLIKKGRWTYKKKQRSIFGLVIFVWVIIMIGLIITNGNKERNKVLNNYEKIHINNMDYEQSDNFETYYKFNKVYINGIVIKKSNNKYYLYDENNNFLVKKPINKIQFTFSNVIVLEIHEEFYLYDTKTRTLGEQSYNEIYVVDVNQAGKEKKSKKLLINSNPNSWSLCNLRGEQEMKLDENVIIPLKPTKVSIDENGVVILS
ncbi:hypothetical protein FDF31_16255 [Clostridium sporogenes]|uniref:J domain-containing protein n=1 Tax=unclassified Clostridium TaxID=2614128 RepID=UPI0013D44990|nr:hypothetical protein [Clostridium sporogenes]NFS27111.1 hypothetical protein [Clostridium sporogenes]